MNKRLRVFNTESRQKEEIVPLHANLIRLYTCGPTVYNFAHIGNFRTYVFEDLLRRTLKYFGYQVEQVMNITDVEDKIIKGALQEKKSLQDFTAPYIQAFFEDLATLRIEKVEHYPYATDFIPQMIEIIKQLLDKEIAYRGADGSIYYAISRFPSYGRLSHLKMDELKVGGSQRIGIDEYDKEHAADFVLWKSYDPDRDGEIFWESPFGKGRPGWHIECSAMAMALLGESLDIHVGGVDNMFPHHENEIAQSEACSGKCFVRYWLHAEHLLVDHKKMSKSLGNFYTLRDLLKMGYSGLEVRLMLLNSHYRTQLNFTLLGLDAARATLERLSDFVERLNKVEDDLENLEAQKAILEAKENFTNALADDLNVSSAFAALFEMIRKFNYLYDQKTLGKDGAKKALAFLQEVEQVFGIFTFEKKQLELPLDLVTALAQRNEARKAKNWVEADRQRDYITSKGYIIEDSPEGSRLKKIL